MIAIADTTHGEMKLERNGVIEYYPYIDFKAVSPYKNSNGEYIIIINFINESRDSSLKIPLAQIVNQPTWTTIDVAVSAISIWMTSYGNTSALATEATLQSVDSSLNNVETFTSPGLRTANARRFLNSNSIIKPYSFSIANVGAANGTILGPTGGACILQPGEIVNYDAGVLNNTFPDIFFNATGTEFLVTWVS